VHHFGVAGDVEENNPLFDSRGQVAEEPFSLGLLIRDEVWSIPQ
jgi:hypothetical protein